MGKEERYLRVGSHGQLIDLEGREVEVPSGWIFLPAGDAGLTRKVTAKTRYWRVQAQMGRRTISKGIWAAKVIIEEAKSEIETIRASETYQQKLAGDRRRRAAKQLAYEGEFFTAVCAYLNFALCYQDQQRIMAEAITRHAVPVGSGTVARTTRIPIEERASRAVIAWMRHQTTAYDSMLVARIKGERRRVRRLLAQRSVELLEGYRQGREIPLDCPLMRALKKELPAAPESTAGSRVENGSAGGVKF